MSNPNTPPRTPTYPGENDELAQLFGHLVSVSSRPRTPGDCESIPIPENLVPILKKISDTAAAFGPRESGNRRRRDIVPPNTPITRSDDTAMDDTDSSDDLSSLGDFSRADTERFAFGYKHHIHKLYEQEEFIKRVEKELESSRNRYRPLGEQIAYAEAESDEEEPSKKDGIKFVIPVTPPSRNRSRRGSVAATGQRSDSFAGGRSPAGEVAPPTSPCSRYPMSPTVSDEPEIKKRCVSRRKSLSGLLGRDQESQTYGTLVYTSTVSAAEHLDDVELDDVDVKLYPAPVSSPTIQLVVDQKYEMLGMNNLPAALQRSRGLKRRASASRMDVLHIPTLSPLKLLKGKNLLVERRRAKALERNKA